MIPVLKRYFEGCEKDNDDNNSNELTNETFIAEMIFCRVPQDIVQEIDIFLTNLKQKKNRILCRPS